MSRTYRTHALTLLLLLPGCDISYATFVTATHVGIKADTKTEQVGIGVGRTDLFIGPGYPEKGTAPSAFGYLQTNAQIFSPQVTQLYATGAAADAVTHSLTLAPPANPTAPELSGVRRPLVFGTNTDIGLKLGFVANAPSSIDFGYNREELSIIPLQPALAASGKDVYAPVLAAVTLNVSTGTLANTSLGLRQFFATGNAATNLASSSTIQKLFNDTAAAQVNQATLQAAIVALTKNVSTVKTYLDSGNGYATNCPKLKAVPAFRADLWDSDPCTLSEADFINTLNKRPDLAWAAAAAVPTGS